MVAVAQASGNAGVDQDEQVIVKVGEAWGLRSCVLCSACQRRQKWLILDSIGHSVGASVFPVSPRANRIRRFLRS